jgi:hypothetical protein
VGTGLLRQFLIVAFLAHAVIAAAVVRSVLDVRGFYILCSRIYGSQITLVLEYLPARKETSPMRRISRLATLAFLIFSGVLITAAQSTPPASPAPPRAHQEPCWRQAGIDRSIMEQRRDIERDAHSRVDAVCETSSLAPQQRRQQVREIREQARQKSDALITSDQRSALQACQQGRPEYGADRIHRGGGDPCRNHEANPGPVSPEQNGPTGKASGSNPQAPENNSSPN